MPLTTTVMVAPKEASQRYTKKWDLWINGYLDMAVKNCLNSLNIIEMDTETRSSTGGMKASGTSRVSWDRAIGNVKWLQALVLEEWKDDAYRRAVKGQIVVIDLDRMEMRENDYDPFHNFHAVWSLFARRGFLRLLPQRTLGR